MTKQKSVLCQTTNNAILPKYKNIGDAGMDVEALTDYYVKPGETIVIPIGLKIVIPEGYELQIRPRSGISLNTPLRMPNSIGTIDSGYRDELKIILNNSSQKEYNIVDNKLVEIDYPIYAITEKGNKTGIYHIKKGDRIAQIILTEFTHINWVETNSVEGIGLNRGGGLGSTGVN